MDIPFWVIQPFSCSAIEYEPVLQEQLIDLQSDVEAQCIFRESGWEKLWLKSSERFPVLWEKVRPLLFCFPTTYLAEQGFSQTLYMQTKYRNRLDLVKSGALCLKLTTLSPEVEYLAKSHQAQRSH